MTPRKAAAKFVLALPPIFILLATGFLGGWLAALGVFVIAFAAMAFFAGCSMLSERLDP